MLASLNHASVSFGSNIILKDVTWAIKGNEHWGVIGHNGAGKSTVFKALLGAIELSSGTVVKPVIERNVRVGYYAQDLLPQTDGTVLEEVLSTFVEVETASREMRKLEELMSSDRSDLELIMNRYQIVQEKFDILDGFSIKSKAESTLFSLGFTKDILQKKVSVLSGGQRCRVMLAKSIIAGKDLILLDEPTNHLDLPSLKWLESFIKEAHIACAIISHDRYFLDRVVTNVIEIEHGYSTCYIGNYSDFIEKKMHELDIAERHFDNQQTYVKKQEEYINRNIAGRNSKMARGRRTHLEKLQRLDKPIRDRRKIKFIFDETVRSGDIALILENASIGWNKKAICNTIKYLEVKRGQKLAIVGLNGTGKSTLLKSISNEIEFITGGVKLGSQVRLGYFDQNHKNLDHRNTIYQQIQSITPAASKKDILSFLAKFQFRADEVDKMIPVLSGGERARLSIATLIRQGVNLLLLDEPTNHMDIRSMEAMEDAIISFSGAVMLVTHDRYLLGRVSDSILRIDNEKIDFFDGGYEENRNLIDHNDHIFNDRLSSKLDHSSFNDKNKNESFDCRNFSREKEKLVKRCERKIREVELNIIDLEARLAAIDIEISSIDTSNWQEFDKYLNMKNVIQSDLDKAIVNWETAYLDLEQAQV